LVHTGDSPKRLNAIEVYENAKKYKAEITPGRQIRWMDIPGEWVEILQYRPSVLDSLILQYAPQVGPSYLAAACAATGWNRRTILGFLQIMLIGRPVESEVMNWSSRGYWQGVVIGLIVYEKLRKH